MKEHPILFSAPMVRALLADQKHVTRRLSKSWLKVKAGDRLWVRETFEPQGEGRVLYRADRSTGCGDALNRLVASWRPSIHMPRWASRILMECEEDARVERLRSITEEDAIAEGVQEVYPKLQPKQARNAFFSLWSTLHTKPGERLEDNPEVVRVGRFRRVT